LLDINNAGINNDLRRGTAALVSVHVDVAVVFRGVNVRALEIKWLRCAARRADAIDTVPLDGTLIVSRCDVERFRSDRRDCG
jgi:hypothetical protein